METVYSDLELIAIGMAAVYVEAEKKGWNCYVAYGKFSVTEPTQYKTEKGTPYLHVWQTENYAQNGVSAVCAVSQTKDGNHSFAKKPDGKLWRKRVAGLNAYNIAMTNDGTLVKYEDGELPKEKTSTFDSSF